jgi:hypothetical protein
MSTNIRIISNIGELDYKSNEFSIELNRITDDMQDLSNRFQDFSYEFELPFTKKNSRVFGAPEAKGSKGIFKINQSIGCQVYLTLKP